MSDINPSPAKRVSTTAILPDQIVCPKCGGEKQVQIVAMSEEQQSILMYGKPIPCIGSILRTECSLCEGQGSFSRKENRVFYEFLKAYEELTDDSRVPIALVHSKKEVVEFLRKMFPDKGNTRSTDFREPVETELEVFALSITERFQANGLPFRVQVHQLSSTGVGIRHSCAFRSNFLLIQLVTPELREKQFVTKVVHRGELDGRHESWCEYVIKAGPQS